jgi:glucokinase
MTQKPELPVLAIDLGGTKITAAIVNEGKIIAKEHQYTKAQEGPEPVINEIFSITDHLLEIMLVHSSEIKEIGIAAAGAIDVSKGIVTVSPNLFGWHNIPLRDIVEKKYGLVTYVLNDANAAALGEHRFGAGRGVDNLIMLTLGTGIGGGIIINGELYMGPSGTAGEIGHMSIDAKGAEDTCGNAGCLELMASGSTIAKEAIACISRGEKSSMTNIVGDNLGNITAEMVGVAAGNGDRLAITIISKMINYLGTGLVNLVNIFNPELIVIGGGMSNMGVILFESLRQIVREKAFRLASDRVRIVPAELGNDAGVIGAAVYVSKKRSRTGGTR